MNLRIATAQTNIQFDHIHTYSNDLQEHCRQAAAQGAHLLMLPELWIHGYHKQTILNKPEYHLNAVLPVVQQIARESHIAVVGTYVEDENELRYNTMVIVDESGTVLGKYRKTHLFRPLNEDRYFSAGDEAVVVDTPWGKIGLAICYDIRFPELFRTLLVKGAEGFLVCAEWPSSRSFHWDTLSTARAIENQCWLACVSCAGKTGNHEFGGLSKVILPNGQQTVADDQPGVFFFDLDTVSTQKYRSEFPVLRDIRIDFR